MPKRVIAVMLAGALAAPVLAQDQIVIPDDDTRLVQAAPGARDTTLEMRAVTVKDQSQLRGKFGDAWTADEVQGRAAQICAEGGMRMVYFQPGNSDSKGRTDFAAVCQ